MDTDKRMVLPTVTWGELRLIHEEVQKSGEEVSESLKEDFKMLEGTDEMLPDEYVYPHLAENFLKLATEKNTKELLAGETAVTE